jgi:hypothetical protein
MTAARAALALVLLASAVQITRAEPCAPRAELAGDAEAVAKVAAELQRLGVEASTDPANRPPRGSCPVIVAAVELDRGGGIAVAVRDGSQRSEGRVVSDAVLAAAWIDSWLRDDFEVPLAAPIVAPPAAPAVRVDEAPAAATVSMLDRFSLAASFVQSWSDDRSSWSGVAGSLCLRAGEVCVGGRFSYAKQTVVADLTAAAKHDLALLATASYSQDIGRMSVAPEVGIGIGRLTTTRVEGCKPVEMTCGQIDPMNLDCVDPPPDPCTSDPTVAYVGDEFSTSTFTPRISAALRIAIPLFDHVWLDGIAAATLSPMGHSADYQDKDAINADGTMNPAYPLPGDPLFGVQLGIGLRLGAR